MKTLINQYGDIVRHDDVTARQIVSWNYGWKYCPKHLWKGKRRDAAQQPDKHVLYDAKTYPL